MYVFQPDRFLLQKDIAKVSKYIKGRTLDVGAGQCARYKQLFPEAEFVNMDIEGRENVDVVGSADAIPFENNSFNSVLCTQVFEHLSEPFTSAREIHRILKSGGYAIVTVPQINELHEEPNDFYRYTCYGLRHLFQSNGFEVVECIQRGGYFTMMAQQRTRYLIDRFNLYKRPFFGRVVSKFLKLHSLFGMWLDSKDDSVANRKHTIGWTVLLRKPYEDTHTSR